MPNTVRLGKFKVVLRIHLSLLKKKISSRSYLRKSRILESNTNGLVTNTEGNLQQNESMISMAFPLYPITPRDILKFAWQISKGMAYLAELKVKYFFCI